MYKNLILSNFINFKQVFFIHNFKMQPHPQKPSHHRRQTLDLKNGYVQTRLTTATNGPGHELMDTKVNELPDLLTYNPHLVYGKSKPPAPQPFVPNFVQLNNKAVFNLSY